MSQGVGAAIGLSAIFGFFVLCGCCGFIFRRRPASHRDGENMIIRQVTIVEPKERGKSVTEEDKERKKSTHELSSVINVDKK